MRRPAKRFQPWRDREAAVEAALDAREQGGSLRAAAAAAGVHVATLCRWLAADELLRAAMRDATAYARLQKYLQYLRQPPRRPSVPWRRDCPRCGAEVVVRTTGPFAGFHFWRCSRWPGCPFASWRPRAPEDCPRCGGPRFWSHSRRSIGCPGCGYRSARAAAITATTSSILIIPHQASGAVFGP